MELFRRLKTKWNTLDIDYDNLVLFDYLSVPDWMAKEAECVLDWGLRELEKGTWPRDDYKELLKLVVISLGGKIKDFRSVILLIIFHSNMP